MATGRRDLLAVGLKCLDFDTFEEDPVCLLSNEVGSYGSLTINSSELFSSSHFNLLSFGIVHFRQEFDPVLSTAGAVTSALGPNCTLTIKMANNCRKNFTEISNK